MQKELEAKLAEINADIDKSWEFLGDEAIGRYYVLKEMKEWLEGVITNYCE